MYTLCIPQYELYLLKVPNQYKSGKDRFNIIHMYLKKNYISLNLYLYSKYCFNMSQIIIASF